MRAFSSVCIPLLAAVLAVDAGARNVWLVRGLVGIEPPLCHESLTWNADAILHNLTDDVRTVTVVDTSPGKPSHGDTVTIEGRRSRALSRLPERPDFALGASMWITRLEVPDGIQVEGRLEYIFDSCGRFLPPNDLAAGKVALPVFDHLTAAGEPQVHFGTDLGVQPARYNVGVFNAGDTSATAVVEVTRPACLGDQKVTRSLAVPPGTLVQESLFEIGTGCTGQHNDLSVGQWVTYTTVTVDQPSLSYVVALSGSNRPQVMLGFGSK